MLIWIDIYRPVMEGAVRSCLGSVSLISWGLLLYVGNNHPNWLICFIDLRYFGVPLDYYLKIYLSLIMANKYETGPLAGEFYGLWSSYQIISIFGTNFHGLKSNLQLRARPCMYIYICWFILFSKWLAHPGSKWTDPWLCVPCGEVKGSLGSWAYPGLWETPVVNMVARHGMNTPRTRQAR